MTSTECFQPDWSSPPGNTIRSVLGNRAISDEAFASSLGESVEFARELLDGRTTITISLARRLVGVLGASVEFWMTRDFQYRQEPFAESDELSKWRKQLPIGDMIRFGWLKPAPRPSEETASCLNFFGVDDVVLWGTRYSTLSQMAVFKRTETFESKVPSVAAWLRQGEIEAQQIKCNSWISSKFSDCLENVRKLTKIKNPQVFVPKLQQICASAGVAVVVVRAPSGCPVSGATRFISPTKAILQLSFRYLSDDHFWFTFFHEAGHLILHGTNRLFLEDGDHIPDTLEEEANEFAEQSLIPQPYLEELFRLRVNTRDVIRFATRIGIAPGIVVGQLQHYGKIKPNQLNRLKRRYVWT